MTQGTWIAITALALFLMNIVAKDDLPAYAAVFTGTAGNSTPQGGGTFAATTALSQMPFSSFSTPLSLVG